jgi:predicted transcriptional regulator YdeE
MKKLILLIVVILLTIVIYKKIRYDNYMKQDILTVGTSFQTTNKHLMETGGTEIQSAIAKVFTMPISNLKEDGNLYIVYTGYDENFKNDPINSKFTIHIGREVSSFAANSSNESKLTLKSGKYEIFTTKKGNLGQVVSEKWQEIWADKKLAEKRSYISDFEVYTGNENPESAEIKIYIGVNN